MSRLISTNALLLSALAGTTPGGSTDVSDALRAAQSLANYPTGQGMGTAKQDPTDDPSTVAVKPSKTLPVNFNTLPAIGVPGTPDYREQRQARAVFINVPGLARGEQFSPQGSYSDLQLIGMSVTAQVGDQTYQGNRTYTKDDSPLSFAGDIMAFSKRVRAEGTITIGTNPYDFHLRPRA